MKRIGVLVPATNYILEDEICKLYEYGMLKTNDVVFHLSKINIKTRYYKNKNKYISEIKKNIYPSINLLSHLKLDDICFGCTIASVQRIQDYINPLSAIINYCLQKNLNNFILITPYNEDLTEKIAKEMETFTIKFHKKISLDLQHSLEYVNYGYNLLEDLILKECSKTYKNIIICCTNIPTLHIINKYKNSEFKIISSNSALFHQVLTNNNIYINL